MVINRIIKRSLGYGRRPYFQFPKYRGNPINWIIADRKRRSSNKKRSGVVTFRHVPLKRIEYTTGVNDVSNTPIYIPLNSIPQGTSVDGERTEQRIVAKTYSLRSMLYWEFQTGYTNTPTLVRAILCTTTPGYTGTGVTVDANIYDKRDFSDIGHVYKDLRIMRKQSNITVSPLNMNVNLKNIHFNYTDDTAASQQPDKYSQLTLLIVSNVSTSSKTSWLNVNSVLRYHG